MRQLLHLIALSIVVGRSITVLAFVPAPRFHIFESAPFVCTSHLCGSPGNEDEDSSTKKERNAIDDVVSSTLSRFTSPQIDDPYLPLSDAMVAQIVAPSAQIAFLALTGAARPSWLQPIVNKAQLFGNGSGSLLAPTLIHGAALASCWLVGALAARAYERDAIAVDPRTKGYGTVIGRVIQAGSFATGVLILCTQLGLYREFGGYVQFGDGPETDFRIQVAFVEGFYDVLFEAVTLLTWRLYLAFQSSKRL